MKIYTRQGDQGQTGLIGGTRISKTDSLIEACGTVDELNASLGVVRSALEEKGQPLIPDLVHIQQQLHIICSELAGVRSETQIPELESHHIRWLEDQCDHYDSRLPELRYFILPGGVWPASLLHQSRTICRRAERRVFEAKKHHPIPERNVIYLNRLSDLLYLMARYINYDANHEEIRTDYDTNKTD
ncbi:MAG: cob(I)yrinic acid a,c-diamide adenosyltransferase [Calditrichota bacterium]